MSYDQYPPIEALQKRVSELETLVHVMLNSLAATTGEVHECKDHIDKLNKKKRSKLGFLVGK